ncbi:hypothetical protein [Vampirovibrio sp.]|uniref:hypothetical protein n=1 Tax=Vampirovibrio sp. TaxID=2717857 RepID=UPI0035945F8C
MGQPFPQFQKGAFPPALNGLMPPQQPSPDGPVGMNPLQAAAMAQGGVDPRMMAQAQQQVADPNGGDLLNIFPGPKEMGIGMVAGLGTAYGFSALMGQQYNGPIPAVAKWLDNVPGVRKLTDWAGARYQKLGGKHPWLKEGLLTTASSVPVNLSKDPAKLQWQKYAQNSVSDMEKRHIEAMMEKFPNRFNDNLKKAYEQQYLQAKKLDIIKAYNQHVDKNFKQRIKDLPANSDAYQEILRGKEKRRLKADTPFFNFAQKDAQWLKNPHNLNFETTLNQARAQLHYLENATHPLSPDEKQILQKLRGLKERIRGLKGHYKPAYEAQAKLTAKLAEGNVGPLGRMMALSGQYIQRIFNGDTLSLGSKSIFNASLLGPLMAGGFLFGMSLQKAKNAKEGEKTRTFFHDFFGTGIANFVGWELGRKWLNSSTAFHKLLGKFGTMRPFDNAVGSRIPIFGERFGKGVQKLLGGEGSRFAKGMGTVFGKGIGGFFARLTMGGLATELIAMFAIGSAFQFGGEKIAHLIFGKPSKDSLDGKGKQPAQAPQGIITPPGMQPAGGMAPNPMSKASVNSPQNPLQPPGFVPQAPAGIQPKAMPSFSLSPSQIIDNPASKQMKSMESSIISNYDGQQKKSHGRTNYFDPSTL